MLTGSASLNIKKYPYIKISLELPNLPLRTYHGEYKYLLKRNPTLSSHNFFFPSQQKENGCLALLVQYPTFNFLFSWVIDLKNTTIDLKNTTVFLQDLWEARTSDAMHQI